MPGEIDRYDLTLSLSPGVFPSVTTYEPVWSATVQSYYVWIPASSLREKFVPPHFKGVFSLMVGFVWNIIFATIMAANR